MSIFKWILVGIDRVNEWIGKILAYFLFLMFILLMVEVIRRYFFNSPTVWQNELAQYLFGAYAILSGGFILRAGAHVNVDIIFAHFSEKTQAWCNIITSTLFFLFIGMMLIYGGSFAWESISRWEHSQSAWNPPVWPIKATIPLGAILLLLQGVVKLVKDICLVMGKEPPVKPATAHEGENI